MLPRLQLFEFNDLPGAPAALRDTVVESLSRTLAWGRVLAGVVPPFEEFLRQAGVNRVLDLGSGAGGPARILVREIRRAGHTPPEFLLSDLHPRVEAWEAARRESPDAIAFERASVDATNIPPRLGAGRVRTIVNVLHHFPPPLAGRILEDAVRSSRGVFVVEPFGRNPLAYANLFPAGLPALLLNPLLSPRERLAKGVITWLTPTALLVGLWDGVVSAMRMYTEDDLRTMVAPFGDSWRWVHGTYSYFPHGTGTYFYGVERGA